MKVMSSKQFQRGFGQVVIDVQHEPIKVERFGKTVGYFVSVKDWEMSDEERQLREELWESRDEETQRLIKMGRENPNAGVGFEEWCKK